MLVVWGFVSICVHLCVLVVCVGFCVDFMVVCSGVCVWECICVCGICVSSCGVCVSMCVRGVCRGYERELCLCAYGCTTYIVRMCLCVKCMWVCMYMYVYVCV